MVLYEQNIFYIIFTYNFESNINRNYNRYIYYKHFDN